MNYSVNTFLVLFLGLQFSCSQKPTDYKLIETALSSDKYGIPLKKIAIKMPNQQELFIAEVSGFQLISGKQKEALELPKKTVFAFNAYYAGVGTYYYGWVEQDRFLIYKIEYEEEGFQDDPILEAKYINKEGRWIKSNEELVPSPISYRNQNWHPDRGQYFFSEHYDFSFLNETFDTNDVRREGRFGFYFDSLTGTVLLVSGESYFDEMTEWILIRPQQDYIVSYSEEHGGNRIDTIAMDSYLKYYSKRYNQDVQRSFTTFFEPLPSSTKIFSQDKYCIESLSAKAYSVKYEGAVSDSTILHLAQTPFNWNTFNNLYKSDACPEGGLKIHLTGLLLPKNLFAVEEQSWVNGKNINFRLDCIYASDYHLQIQKQIQ